MIFYINKCYSFIKLLLLIKKIREKHALILIKYKVSITSWTDKLGIQCNIDILMFYSERVQKIL